MTATSFARRQSAIAQRRRKTTNGNTASTLNTMIRRRIFIPHDHTMALPRRVYPQFMGEVAIAILVIGVLFISDPDRLQAIIDRLREFSAWLAE